MLPNIVMNIKGRGTQKWEKKRDITYLSAVFWGDFHLVLSQSSFSGRVRGITNTPEVNKFIH